MSRALGNTAVNILDAAALSDDSIRSLFIQAADPETMERLFLQQIRNFASINNTGAQDTDWRLTHLDLAGAGDGHTFALNTTWAKSDQVSAPDLVVDNGLNPSRFQAFFFMAAQATALAAARQGAQRRLADLFEDPVNASQVAEAQTVFSGAEQGTRVMGGVVAAVSFITGQ